MQQNGAPRGQKNASRAGGGGGARRALSPTGTEDTTSGDAARQSR